MSLSNLRYTKQADPNLFIKVIQKLYPHISYHKGYISGSDSLGKTDDEFFLRLADDIDSSKKSNKFLGYAEYIRKLCKRNRNDKTKAEFVKSLKILTRQPLSKIAVKKTTKTTYDEITDRNITEVDVEKEYYSSGNLKRERIVTRKIPKRVTRRKTVEETVKITYKSYLEENRKKILKNIEDLNDPVLSEFSKEVADLLKGDEWNIESMKETARDSLCRRCRDTETDFFSYTKSNKALRNYNPKIPLSVILKNRDSEVLDYFRIVKGYLPDIDGLSQRENLYVKLKYMCGRTYQFSDDLTEKMSQIADECCIESMTIDVQQLIEL